MYFFLYKSRYTNFGLRFCSSHKHRNSNEIIIYDRTSKFYNLMNFWSWSYIKIYVIENILNFMFLVKNLKKTDSWCKCKQISMETAFSSLPEHPLGYVTMQCQQKRYDLYISLLWTFVILLSAHVITSGLSLLWSFRWTHLRRITSIINNLKDTNYVERLIESKETRNIFYRMD